MEIKIIGPDDKRLKEKSIPITDFNEDYKTIIERMKTVCLEHNAYACAAPQLGILKRFILIMTKKEMKTLDMDCVDIDVTPYFNPVITKMNGSQMFWEACMSVPKTIGKVRRPYSIEIEAQDIDGKPIKKRMEDFEAIIFCHEIDHLDGIEFTDRAFKISYDITKEERMEFRKCHPHEILDKTEPFEY